MTKVFCRPCKEGPGAWTHAYDILKDLYAASAPRIHQWVESPEEADVILLSNPVQKEGDVADAQPIRVRYPDKSFILSDQWTPEPKLAGIYANAPKKAFWHSRFRSASYALNHPDFKNPYVEGFDPNQAHAPEKRDVLFSFAGRNCHPIRERLFHHLFRRSDIVVQDTSKFDAFQHGNLGKDAKQREYLELCLRSKYILCPRGVGPNSIRLFEALRLGIAPVIVSDAWIPCEGPDWRQFALFVAERDIDRIEEIVGAHEAEFVERGREAFRAHEAFFAPQSYFNYLVSAADSIRHSRRVSERTLLRVDRALDFSQRVKAKLFQQAASSTVA